MFETQMTETKTRAQDWIVVSPCQFGHSDFVSKTSPFNQKTKHEQQKVFNSFWTFDHLELRICFEFRYSDFEF